MSARPDMGGLPATPTSSGWDRSPEAWSGSILFQSGTSASGEPPAEPSFFGDLNLDHICAALTHGREEYNLAQFFFQPLRDVESINYRHDVLHDIERDDISNTVYAFAEQMRLIRRQLALVDKLRDRHQRERWFLSALTVYCAAVVRLEGELQASEPVSEAVRGFARHLGAYVESTEFKDLTADTSQLQAELDAIRYQILIHNLRVEVAPYEDAPDLTEQIEETFEKFRQGAVEDHRVEFHQRLETNTAEERILAVVAEVFPTEFAHADRYLAGRRKTFLEGTVARFDREVQFYLAYLEHIAPLKAGGLEFTYPEVSATEKAMHARESFDLALASNLIQDGKTIVSNDVELDGVERVIVVSGPNQGGKTTFARMFGQLHHLAALGLPVPGSDAALYLPDRLFTHFEREEDLTTLRGKFEDELVRLHEILQVATDRSVLIMNESFSSTSLQDALWVGERVLQQVINRDMICLCVTFIDELASLGDSVVSMMSTVNPDDPARRTFEVVRKPADGLAYAIALAEKHGITYDQLKGRLAQ